MGLGRRMRRANSPGYGNDSAGARGVTGASLDVAEEASQLTDAVNLQDVGTRLPGERGTEQ